MGRIKLLRKVNNRIEKVLDKVVIPGFDGIPLYRVIVFFLQNIKQGSLTVRASSIAFNIFLAIFPSLIFFLSMIAYIPIDNFHEELLRLLKGIMPEYAYQTIQATIVDTISNKRTGLLSLGFIMTLYFSANGVNSMISAFNASQLAKETRSWLQKRITSLIIVVTESVLLTVALGMIVFSQKFFKYMLEMGWIEKDITFYLIVFGKWVISIALLFFAISFLYFFAPVRKKRFRLISAGSTLATGLLILTSLGFSYYVSNFANYNKIYGSLGTLIVLLLWFYFSSLVLLIGYELNLSIKQYDREAHPIKTKQP